jgi:predicted Fe-S protein YdhL (DUF1289 family)
MTLIVSPCIRNCCLDTADICLGCGRSLQDIMHWTSSSEVEKQQIIDKAQERKQVRDARLSGYFAGNST